MTDFAAQLQSCPFCPGASSKPIFQISPDNRVVRCGGCGLQYQELYPDLDRAREEIYSDKYFEVAIEKQAEREAIFGEMLSRIEWVSGRKGRLLDVGSAEGLLLSVAASKGWQPEGTEVSREMIRHVRDELGFPVHDGFLEEIAVPDGSFDAIVLNHVLEHVQNPLTTLQTVARLLAPGGVVRIEVPNLASLSSQIKNLQSRLHLKSHPWKHYGVGHHFWFFEPATLRNALTKSGLKIARLEAPARLWGETDSESEWSITSSIYNEKLWGGKLVAFACKEQSES